MTKRIVVAVAIATATLGVGATSVSAAGGNGNSFCSNSGAPLGAAPDEYGNAGEIISWIARNVGHGRDNHPGPVVAFNCNPNRA